MSSDLLAGVEGVLVDGDAVDDIDLGDAGNDSDIILVGVEVRAVVDEELGGGFGLADLGEGLDVLAVIQINEGDDEHSGVGGSGHMRVG